MSEIKITLETLYDVLRNEKKREDLQKLDATFFVDVVSYLREKKTLLDSKQDSDELFAAGERDKLDYELRSIKRILREIYEKREKKIIDIALNKSKTGSDIIDTSAMLREEKEFYQQLLAHLDTYRLGVLRNVLKAELPFITPKDEPALPVKKEEPDPEKEEQEPLTKIKFTHPVPSFVWKDMKVYGPFETGDEIDIFPEVAELIVRKGRAEKV